jgi:hypothetical protein
MSSSPAPDDEPPTGAGAKSSVFVGTSLWGVKRPPFWPPFSPPSREPRNWTESATISTAWRLFPSLSVNSRHSRRPSMATGRPFLAARVAGDPQAADGGSAVRAAQLGIAGEVAGHDDPVDVGCCHSRGSLRL